MANYFSSFLDFLNFSGTWDGDQTGLQRARLGRHSGVGALHGDGLLGAGAGYDIWRLPLPLQSLLDRSWIRRQVGQLVEHVALADYGVH